MDQDGEAPGTTSIVRGVCKSVGLRHDRTPPCAAIRFLLRDLGQGTSIDDGRSGRCLLVFLERAAWSAASSIASGRYLHLACFQQGFLRLNQRGHRSGCDEHSGCWIAQLSVPDGSVLD
jgi:hypothetical protein